MTQPWLDIFARPQMLVEIGDGRRLNLYDTGEGPVTVILAHGFGGRTLSWFKVQPEVAKFARVVSYDRAGFGFSDPGPMPRTASRSVADLRAALAAQGVAPPYLLAGHSSGSLDVRYFAYRYPDEVVGIVISDGTSEGPARALRGRRSPIHDSRSGRDRHLRTERNLRGSWTVPNRLRPLPAAARTALDRCRQRSLARLVRQRFDVARDGVGVSVALWRQFGRSFGRAARSRVPAHSRSDRRASRLAGPGQGRQRQAAIDLARAQQREFAALSSRGVCREVADSGHSIPFERPQAVIDAIRHVAEMIG